MEEFYPILTISDQFMRNDYLIQSEMSDPGPYASAILALPKSIDALCEAVQSTIIHDAWIEANGLVVTPDTPVSRKTLSVPARLNLLRAETNEVFVLDREPQKKSIGTCRDLALMLVSMLRLHQIPARLRCGFADYFEDCVYHDHWVAEYWHQGDARWARCDPQLDGMQRERLAIGFDVIDIPAERFLNAWQAWQMCRSGRADPDAFSWWDHSGYWLLRVDLARDLLALQNQETSLWDNWRQSQPDHKTLTALDLHRCDCIAAFAASLDRGDQRGLHPEEITEFLTTPPWLM